MGGRARPPQPMVNSNAVNGGLHQNPPPVKTQFDGWGQQIKQPGFAQQNLQDVAKKLPKLYCFEYPGPNPHWGFLHMDNPRGSSGVLIHIGAEVPQNMGSKGAISGRHPMRWIVASIDSIRNSSISVMVGIPGTHELTLTTAKKVLRGVYERSGDYQLLMNNCQHFCIQGLQALMAVCPEITPQVCQDVIRRTSGPTQATHALKNGVNTVLSRNR